MKEILSRLHPLLLKHRTMIAISTAIVVLLGGGLAWAAAFRGNANHPLWVDPAGFPAPVGNPTPAPTPAPDTISMSSVGDIVMASAPSLMPANDGKNFFDQVKHLFPADLVMGNLEETLTEDTGHSKCAPDSQNCRAFRAPPHYAQHLKSAGFHVLN